MITDEDDDDDINDEDSIQYETSLKKQLEKGIYVIYFMPTLNKFFLDHCYLLLGSLIDLIYFCRNKKSISFNYCSTTWLFISF